MQDFNKTAILGAGVIGASWAALFLASGRDVAVFDPAPDAEALVRAHIADAWPALGELGRISADGPGHLSFHRSAAAAVAGADFVQESVPERIAIKHRIHAEIEPALAPHAVVASSTSGLMLSDMQAGWRDPARLVLGHPFNPPHLIPLVEVMGNDRTDPQAIVACEGFYAGLGKVTIRLHREVIGHVANRLQAALWREAIHLATTGVASVEDIDKAVRAGPGLRWAAMGPTMLFHLGGGAGGLTDFADRLGDSFNRWFDDLGAAHLDPETVAQLLAGVEQAAGDASITELAARRDRLIVAMQQAMAAQHQGD